MNDERAKRKLSAILSADVKGYSRLMGEDELSTIETLKKHRALISSLIEQYRGRVVDSPGDNLLAEFGSAVDAVECAVKIQEVIKKENNELPENRRMEFRIGVNLGDVVEDGDSIYGDGVNIAARIESLADAGGISISRSTYDQIKRKLSLKYEYLGEHQVKNIDEPVRVYKVLIGPEPDEVLGEDRLREPASIERMAYPLPDKPSIAVLPFDNMSDDPKQQFLCDGITEEIISTLAKNPSLFVIARNSVFTYKGKPIKVQQVSEDLGVRYVLEGSLRKAGDRVRVTTQLIDAIIGTHIWAERYDRDLKDIFALQDEIAMRIFETMALKLTTGKRVEDAAKGTTNLDAYMKVMEGHHYFNRTSPDDYIQARKLFEEAILLDPGYAVPYILIAFTHINEAMFGWTKTPMKSAMEASKFVKKGQSLDATTPLAYQVLAQFNLLSGQHDKALGSIEHALELVPNNSMSLFIKGCILGFMGESQEAHTFFQRQLRIDPVVPEYPFWGIGWANELMGRYEEAIKYYKKALAFNPKGFLTHLGLLHCYTALERQTETNAEVVEILRLNPDFSAKNTAMLLPYKEQTIKDQLLASYLKAGLPE